MPRVSRKVRSAAESHSASVNSAEKYRQDLGRRLARARVDAGLSQAQLADAVGLSPTTVGGIETGRQLPSVPSIRPLCDAAGLTLEELLP